MKHQSKRLDQASRLYEEARDELFSHLLIRALTTGNDSLSLTVHTASKFPAISVRAVRSTSSGRRVGDVGCSIRIRSYVAPSCASMTPSAWCSTSQSPMIEPESASGRCGTVAGCGVGI